MTDERPLVQRMHDLGFTNEQIVAIRREVHEWLTSYVPYGVDPTELHAELDNK